MTRRLKKEYVLDGRSAKPDVVTPCDGAWDQLLGRVRADELEAAGVPTVQGLLDAVLELAVAKRAIGRFGERRVARQELVRAIAKLEKHLSSVATEKPPTDLRVEMALRRVDRARERLDEIAGALPSSIVARAARKDARP